METFSVCMPVYKGDNPSYFLTAINSVIHQTFPPNEIVLVVDGPIWDSFDEIIQTLQLNGICLKIVKLEQNAGHAVARQTAVDAATNEIIALMDSDDISLANRFEKQLSLFSKESTLSVLGGQIAEFVDSPNNIVSYRSVPIDDAAIKQYLKYRCPFNQSTVIFRKSDVVKAGGYRDWHYNEDYYLWIRMAKAGCKFQNLVDVLVDTRVGRDMYARRGGIRYFKSEYKLQLYMLNHKIINFHQFTFNIFARLIVQVLMPNCVRAFVFKKILRH